MIVVKVGGSLYDLPDLRQRLASFLGKLGDDIRLVPGGGTAAEAVRHWDQVHDLGEEASHWLAIRAMDMGGQLLASLIHDNTIILDAEAWMRQYDELPHSWSVTSDSIAALVALKMNARRLILLKSVNAPADCIWPEAAAKGWVDDYFPSIALRLTCPIQIVNLRAFIS